MIERIITGTVGVSGLAAGVWVLLRQRRLLADTPPLTPRKRARLGYRLLSPDGFTRVIGYSVWLGFFAALVVFSVTRRGLS